MPTPATMGGGANAPQSNNGGKQAATPLVPFARAAIQRTDPVFYDSGSIPLTTSARALGNIEIPADGFLRGVWVYVTASGGTGGDPTVTVNEDAPFNLIKNIILTEPDGSQIHNFGSGYNLMLANKYGGYMRPPHADPRANSLLYSNFTSTFASCGFLLWIPIEINQRNPLGALPNQNAGATFKLQLDLAASTELGSGTFPSTLPSVRVRLYPDVWTQPPAQFGGQLNAVTPPAVGTTQFWSKQEYTISSGDNTVRLTRVGSYIRHLGLVFRANDGTRVTGQTQWPDPLRVLYDTETRDTVPTAISMERMLTRAGYGQSVSTTSPARDTAGGQDYGVWWYDFCHDFDGKIGHELNNGWVPTLGSTLLQLQGTFGGAGTLTVLTNDVAIAGSVWE